MTQATPKDTSTGQHRPAPASILSQDDQLHRVDERRLAGRGLSGERRPSRQEAGHRGASSRTLSKLASSMTYVTVCQPPWR